MLVAHPQMELFIICTTQPRSSIVLTVQALRCFSCDSRRPAVRCGLVTDHANKLHELHDWMVLVGCFGLLLTGLPH